MPPRPRGGGRRPRLPSIRNPTRSPSVFNARASPAPQPVQPVPVAGAQENQHRQYGDRHCPQCPREVEDVGLHEDNNIVCFTCGSIISNSMQYQAEVAFGETSTGAAVVQGTTLQEGQRATAVTGLGYRYASAPDAQQRLQNATQQGREEIVRMAEMLRIGPSIVDQAVNHYSLAKIHSFQRPIRENAAIALYTACRSLPECQVLLIDFAEIIRINVYDLGSAYKKFIERTGLVNRDDITKSNAQGLLEIEPLVLRFASRLEFGSDVRKVANDASAIIARMRRDWMVTGRQPMGLIGASLIIAARMNNYRRTLREVVYVVRAGEMTILKRLNEFSNTAAARLTVAEFRQLRKDEAFNANLTEALPPSVSAPPRKKRKTNNIDDESVVSSRQTSLAPTEASDVPSEAPSEVPSDAPTETPAETEPRRDKDGFVIPSLPIHASPPPALPAHNEWETGYIDPSDPLPVEDPNAVKKPGRPKKQPLPQVDVTVADLEAEEAIEKDITEQMDVIESDKTIIDERGPGWFEAKALADAKREEERRASKWKLSDLDLLSEEIDDDEFEDDPEVKFCKLTEREVQVKERLWVTHNHEWLRQQMEKQLREALAKAQGKKRKTGPRQKMPRRGDGSVLGGEEPTSALESTNKMVKHHSKRTMFSRNVDYARMAAIYGGGDKSKGDAASNGDGYGDSTSEAGSETPTSSRYGSEAPTQTSMSPSPSRSSSILRGKSKITPKATPKGRKRSVSFASSVSVATASSPSHRKGKQTAPIQVEDDIESDDEPQVEDVPTFGDDETEGGAEEDQGDEMDELDEARKFGMDVGDSYD